MPEATHSTVIQQDVHVFIVFFTLACPCLPVLEVLMSTILQGWPFSMTWPFFLSAEHCIGYVCEAPDPTHPKSSSYCSIVTLSFVSRGKTEMHFRDSRLLTHILLNNIKIHYGLPGRQEIVFFVSTFVTVEYFGEKHISTVIIAIFLPSTLNWKLVGTSRRTGLILRAWAGDSPGRQSEWIKQRQRIFRQGVKRDVPT